MTLTILASVSLLALVSSARPLPKPEEHWKALQLSGSGSGEDADVQQAIQAVVKSHASFPQDMKTGDNVYVQLASLEEVQAYLSRAEDDAIKALIPLDQDELHSPDEKELYALLNRLEDERGGRSPVPDELLDSMSLASSSSVSQSVESPSEVNVSESDTTSLTELSVSKPVVIMVASCVIALLAVCCIGAALYIAETFRKSVFRSAWDILPRLEKSVVTHAGRDRVSHVICEAIEGESEKMPGALAVTTHLLHMPSHVSLRETGSDASDFGDDIDEKFFDAESPDLDNNSPYATPKSTPAGLPPGLPALAAAAATVAAVAVTQPQEMCEVSDSSSPILTAAPRPSWSVRAAEAGALVHAHDSQDQRRRRGMFAMPELDAALAMQLRPGLGIGADAAWLVRFVMALFGWCAVLMTGGVRRR